MRKIVSVLLGVIFALCVFSGLVEAALGVSVLWVIGTLALCALVLLTWSGFVRGGREDWRYETRLIRRPSS